MNELGFPHFEPHPLLRNGHAQTVVSAYLRRVGLPYRATTHEVAVAGGDRLVLHDDRPARWRTGDRVAMLIHGLGGCHQSPYMVRIAHKLNAQGVRTFRMDLRGCGAGYRLAQLPGHAGRSDDVATCVAYLAESCPRSPLTLIGISMGGNIALKFLGEHGATPPPNVERAVAVAPPIDLFTCSMGMMNGPRRLYARRFIRALMEQLRHRRSFSPRLADMAILPMPRNLVDFDNRYTAPLNGFRDAQDYYARNSAAPLLSAIKVPTLIVSAEDDPLIPISIFHKARLSATTRFHSTRHGGHVGFLGVRGVDPDRFWLDWRIVQWVTQRPVCVSRPAPMPEELSVCNA